MKKQLLIVLALLLSTSAFAGRPEICKYTCDNGRSQAYFDLDTRKVACRSGVTPYYEDDPEKNFCGKRSTNLVDFIAETDDVNNQPVEEKAAASNLIQHIITTQNRCNAVFSNATYNHGWHQGLSQNIDNQILGGDIKTYRIRWFNGSWSGWFVPGVNDLDWKVNTNNNGAINNTARLVWSYFYDHAHQYIICK